MGKKSKQSNKVGPEEDDYSSSDHYVSIKDKATTEFGPVKKRKCRDIIFLILLGLFWVGMIIVAITAVQNGNLASLLSPKDSLGATCGANNSATNASLPDYSSKKYLYFLDPIGLLGTSGSVCLSSCPTTSSIDLFSNATCKAGVTPTAGTYTSLIASGDCAAYSYESSAIYTVCVPNLGSISTAMINLGPSAGNSTSSLSLSNVLNNGVGSSAQIMSDLVQTWPVLAVSAGAALILSYLWLFIIQWFGTIFVWLVLIAFNGIFIGGAIWLYFYWQATVTNANNSTLSIDNWEVTAAFSGFIAVAILSGIFLLVTIALVKKIRLAVQILKEATSAVKAMPLIVFFPIWIWLGVIVLTCYFIIIMALLLTPKMPITVPLINQSYSSVYVAYGLDGYHVFGYLWTYFFLMGVNQITLAGAFATWYWSLDKKALPRLPVLKSFGRTIRYHLGSVALGSLLLAFVAWLQVLFMFLRRMQAAKNPIIQWILCCCICFLKCIQFILKFINKNAYIRISITGEAFCKAASGATALLIKNALRVGAINVVSTFILLISKLGIAFAIAFCSYIFLNRNPLGYNLRFSFLTVGLSGFIALIIASAFLGVFHLAIDTIFLCFLEDCDVNDGSRERPYYMSENLKRIVNVSNQESEKGGAGKSDKGRVRDTSAVEDF